MIDNIILNLNCKVCKCQIDDKGHRPQEYNVSDEEFYNYIKDNINFKDEQIQITRIIPGINIINSTYQTLYRVMCIECYEKLISLVKRIIDGKVVVVCSICKSTSSDKYHPVYPRDKDYYHICDECWNSISERIISTPDEKEYYFNNNSVPRCSTCHNELDIQEWANDVSYKCETCDKVIDIIKDKNGR